MLITNELMITKKDLTLTIVLQSYPPSPTTFGKRKFAYKNSCYNTGRLSLIACNSKHREPIVMPAIMQKLKELEQRLSQFTSVRALNSLAFLCHPKQPLYYDLTLCSRLTAIPFGQARKCSEIIPLLCLWPEVWDLQNTWSEFPENCTVLRHCLVN